ncbi:MAG: hypothetical protein OXE86_19620 [Alphaproteobacteria bacterium]|nr:hypothetical protein [Alphaproteobacteria bacterium]
MTVCLEAPEELTEQESRGVVDALQENGLKTVLGSLKRRLKDEPGERERIWRENVHPRLREYWPQAAVRNTAGASQAIPELLAQFRVQTEADLVAERFKLFSWEDPRKEDGPASPFRQQEGMPEGVLEPGAEPLVGPRMPLSVRRLLDF